MNILVNSPKGYIRDTFLPEEVLNRLSAHHNVIVNETENHFTKEEMMEKIKDVDILFTGWGSLRLDADIVQHANRLKFVAHTGGSVAGLISEALYQKGVRVISGNDVYARSVAEGVIGYLLLGLRRLPFYMKEMQEKGWREGDFYNEGILDQTIGLVGYGSVAVHLVPMLQAFNMKIKVYSSHMTEEQANALGIQKASLEEIAKTCKIVSLHSAKTPKTYHQMNRELLNMMQEGSVLLNTARGDVLDEEALADVCKHKNIIAVLDVYTDEPLPMDSPLRNQDNILLIPHMCGPTVDQRKVVGHRLVDEMEHFLKGEDLTMEISMSAAVRMSQ